MQSKSNQGSRNTMYLWLTIGLTSLSQITLVGAERLTESLSDQNLNSLAGHEDSGLITDNWYNASDEDFKTGSSYINDKGNYKEGVSKYANLQKIKRRNPRHGGRGRGRVSPFKTSVGNGNGSVGVTQGTGKNTATIVNKAEQGSAHVDSSPMKGPTKNPQPPAVNPTGAQYHTMSTPVKDFDANTGASKPNTFTEKVKDYGQSTTDVLDTIDQIDNHPVTQGIKGYIKGNPEAIADPTDPESVDEPVGELEPETQDKDNELSEVVTEQELR